MKRKYYIINNLYCSNKLKFSQFLHIFLISLILLILISCGKSSEKKAEEFIQAGMFEQAIIYLNQEIQNKPTNPNLHFLLAKCLLATNNIVDAQESFERSMRLNIDKGKQIGTAYFEEGKAAFKKKEIDRANIFFDLAYKYDPSLGSEKIANIYKKAALKKLEKLEINEVKIFSYLIKKYNPEVLQQISMMALDKAKSLSDPDQISNILSLGKFALSINKQSSIDWGNLIYEHISKYQDSTDFRKVRVLGMQAVEWNVTLKEKILKIFFDQSSKALQNKNTYATSNLLKSAISLDSQVSERAAKLVWDKLKMFFENLPSIGVRKFKFFFELCRELGLNNREINSSEFNFANALYLYATGNRTRAINEFKKISVNSVSNHVLTTISKKILSPPVTGTYNINSNPFRFTGTRCSDMGWGGSKGLDIALVKLVITKKHIQLFFSLKASNKPDKLLFIPKEEEISWGVISGNELLYIIDDNGKTFIANNGFEGVKLAEFNSTVKEINVQSWEEVIVKATFPVISTGATKISFFSPQLNGWQTEWSWHNIELKKGPFEK